MYWTNFPKKLKYVNKIFIDEPNLLYLKMLFPLSDIIRYLFSMFPNVFNVKCDHSNLIYSESNVEYIYTGMRLYINKYDKY